MLKFILALLLAQTVCGIWAPQNLQILFNFNGSEYFVIFKYETNYKLNPKQLLAQPLVFIEKNITDIE